jgi:hypothetical protein
VLWKFAKKSYKTNQRNCNPLIPERSLSEPFQQLLPGFALWQLLACSTTGTAAQYHLPPPKSSLQEGKAYEF